MEINSTHISDACAIETNGLFFDAIGDIHAQNGDRVLSYLKDAKYAPAVDQNRFIKGVFCTEEIASHIQRDIAKIIVDDPNWAFFTLIDYIAGKKVWPPSDFQSDFDRTRVFVPDNGVTIGKDVVLEPFVTIYPGTHIADGALIRSGARLGLDTFQHQHTTLGLVSPRHDGELFIGADTEIGANCTISKGFSYRNTIIEESVKIDANAYIGHGARVGANSIICAGTCLMGHVVLGRQTFIGPGAVVSSRVWLGERSRVSIGSVVTRNVSEGMTVSGNFAVPHEQFIARLKSAAKDTQ